MKPRKKTKRLIFSDLYDICERAYSEDIELENIKSLIDDIYFFLERKDKRIKDSDK